MSESKPRGRVLVVAGTDTGVGKTVVALGLITAANRQGLRLRAIKPIESGCRPGFEDEEDGRRLARATGQSEPRAALQRFRSPISPWLAAEREGDAPDPRQWLAAIEAARVEADLVIVEGAGGLLSPLAEGCDLRRLALATRAEVILVAADVLGAQHGALAALEALESVGLAVPALLFSPVSPAGDQDLGNLEILGRVRHELAIHLLPRRDTRDDLDPAMAEALAFLVEARS